MGNKDPRSNQFYPPKVLLDQITRYNWITMKDFLHKHIVKL